MKKDILLKKDSEKGSAVSDLSDDQLSKTFSSIDQEWNNFITNSSPDFIASFDLAGRYTSVNDAFCNAVKMSAADIVGKTQREIGFSEQQANEWGAFHAKAILKNEDTVFATSAVMADNKLHFYKVLLRPFHDENENVIGLGTISRDITDQQNTRDALDDSRKEFYALVDNAPDIIGIHTEGKVVFLNKWGIEVLKAKSKQEVIGKPMMQFVHPDYRDVVKKRAFDAERNHSSLGTLEEKFICLDGSSIDVEVKAIPIKFKNKDSVLIIARDISEQKKAKELLKQERTLLRTVIDNIPDSIYVKDIQGRKIIANAQELRYMGVDSEEEAIGKTDMDIYPSKDAERYISNDEAVFKTGQSVINQYEVVNQTNQKPHLLLTSKVPLRNDQHEIIGLVGIGRDITERQELLEQLHENQERLNKIILSSSDCIWEYNAEGKLIYCSDAVEKIFGYKPSEVIGLSVIDLLSGAEKERVAAHFQSIMQEQKNIIDFEYSFQHKDGHEKYIVTNAFPSFDKEGNLKGYIGLDRDVTANKKSEQNAKKAIITAQENEKYYIGRELHDNVAQLLVGAFLSLSTIKGLSPNDNSKLEQTVADLYHLIDEIRALSHHLAPATFANRDFSVQIEELLKSINKEKRFTIIKDVDDISKAILSSDLQLNLYRILQEQLQNIIKHSNASTIKLSVRLLENNISMNILDNGKGFDINAVKLGIGLENIKNRAEMFLGSCSIESSPGNGCELFIKIPLS